MTIAAGFICTDGILLASDSLYSGQANKHGRKFWILDHDDVVVVFGGAGLEAGLRRTRDEIDRKLKPGLSRIRVVDLVDTAIAKVHEKLPPEQDYKTSALVVIRTSDGQDILYENSGGLNILSPVEHPCQCVGYAQALGWYFASSLFRSGMSLKWAKVVAAHLTKKCKDYSEYCDGDTHFVEVPTSGKPLFIDDQQQVNVYEQHLAGIDEALKIVLPDGRANDDTLHARVDAITAAIEAAKRSFTINIGGVAALGLTGTVSAVHIRPSLPSDVPPTKEGE